MQTSLTDKTKDVLLYLFRSIALRQQRQFIQRQFISFISFKTYSLNHFEAYDAVPALILPPASGMWSGLST